MNEYRIEVIADQSGQWIGNEMTFARIEIAEAHARDLADRWMAVTDWRVLDQDGLVVATLDGIEVPA